MPLLVPAPGRRKAPVPSLPHSQLRGAAEGQIPRKSPPRQHKEHEAAAPSASHAHREQGQHRGAHTPHGPSPLPQPSPCRPTRSSQGLVFQLGTPGHKGTGEEQHGQRSPRVPGIRHRSCPRPPLPSSRAALSLQGRKSGKPCLRAHMEGLGRCPSFSSKKKCTSYGINILVCLLLSSPQAPAQKPQQQPSAQPSWHSLPSDPHSHHRLPRQKPVRSHLDV